MTIEVGNFVVYPPDNWIGINENFQRIRIDLNIDLFRGDPPTQ